MMFVKYIMLVVAMEAGQRQFPAECPKRGTLEEIIDTEAWADRCFMALTGRVPDSSQGESDSVLRDINMDGREELLEIRGAGQKIKQIFVFALDGNLKRYMGQLNATRDFDVIRDGNGEPTILYLLRQGPADYTIMQIKYIDQEYQTVEMTKVK